MSTHETMVNSLLEAYRKIRKENTPEWAVHKISPDKTNELVVPTIPLVGKHYADQPKRILVYASAENLADYCVGQQTDRPWLDEDTQAENRHRNCFEESVSRKDFFFPNVHITPMNNGCLATAVFYIASKLGQECPNLPQEFLETIAFGNYAKYAIETEYQINARIGIAGGNKANIDYTKLKTREAREKLESSLPYLKADIEILEPDIVVLPTTLYGINQKAFDKIKRNAKLIQIYQINAGVINRTIAPKNPKLNKSRLPATVRMWYDNLGANSMTGLSKENYLSVFTYLDKMLENFLSSEF